MSNKDQAINFIKSAMRDSETIMDIVKDYSDIQSALEKSAADNIDLFISMAEEDAAENARMEDKKGNE